MEQVTLRDLEQLVKECKAKGFSLDTPVYIGDDDELNGIHCAWGFTLLEKGTGDEDVDYLIGMIEENSGNISPKNKNILIS